MGAGRRQEKPRETAEDAQGDSTTINETTVRKDVEVRKRSELTIAKEHVQNGTRKAPQIGCLGSMITRHLPDRPEEHVIQFETNALDETMNKVHLVVGQGMKIIKKNYCIDTPRTIRRKNPTLNLERSPEGLKDRKIEQRTCPLTAIEAPLSNPLALRSKGAGDDEGLSWSKSRVPGEEGKGLQLQRDARIIQGTYLISRLESPATSNIQWEVAAETIETCVSPRQMIYAPDNNNWCTTRSRIQQRRLAKNILDHSSTSRAEKLANNPADEYQRSRKREWQQRYKYKKENKRVTHTRKIKCRHRIET
jgi:hypothetical protein